MPAKAYNVLTSDKRYKILEGGRGKGASWSIARWLIMQTYAMKKRVLCTREYQNSIKDSVHRLLSDQIYLSGLQRYFKITDSEIRSHTGSVFLFKGLRLNPTEIKSTEGVDYCWVAEGEKVSADSLDILFPTIRKEDSQIIIDFNPESIDAPLYTQFVEFEGKPVVRDDTACVHMIYDDNPWFPKVLRREMEYCRRVDKDKYEHIWLGRPKQYSADVIFRDKVEIRDFEAPEGTRFFYGADFGFSKDPSVLVRMYIKDEILWIDHEAYGVGVEIVDLPRFFEVVPGCYNWTIVADSARPETISYLAQQGFMIEGAEKGKGSVEDGIQFLRMFQKIIIHPRCKGAIDDFQNYRFKRDRHTSEVLPIPADGSDHAPDACRYGLEKYVKGKVSIYDVL